MAMTSRELEDEMKMIIKVWLKVLISLCFCYSIGKIIPQNPKLRLIFIIPINFLFFYLPLSLSTINFGGTSAFLIAWLANFKVSLFAFGLGPLYQNPPLSLPHFLAVSCLPIKVKNENPFPNSHQNENPSPKSHKNENPSHKNENPSQKSKLYATQKIKIGFLSYPIKILLLGCLIKAHDYSFHMNPNFVLFLYCLHIYLTLDLLLAVSAAMARALMFLGLELEPMFDEPYFSKSLQDFWGRRWNLTVTNILRPTVYVPTRRFIRKRVRRQEWASLVAVVTTFLVSGIMHEIMFYYLGRVTPTGEVTYFFLLHGVCIAVEIWLKKRVSDTWRLPRIVSAVLTVGFVLVTALWLFMPQFSRNNIDVEAFEEYAAIGAYVKNVTKRFVNTMLY